jgi:enterochelin esterase family protein
LLNDLITVIDRNFRTIRNRQYRALAGSAMGGRQAMEIGFSNLEFFGSIGIMSSYPRNLDMQSIYSEYDLNEELELLWLGYGKEDRGYKSGLAFHLELRKESIEHIWYECEGKQVWQVWRKHLYDLAKHLFK